MHPLHLLIELATKDDLYEFMILHQAFDKFEGKVALTIDLRGSFGQKIMSDMKDGEQFPAIIEKLTQRVGVYGASSDASPSSAADAINGLISDSGQSSAFPLPPPRTQRRLIPGIRDSSES